MKRIGNKRGQKKQFWAKATKWYRYQNRVVPVPPCRSQSVPVPIQAVPVPPYRMHSVPVPNRVVPVPPCPKCQDLCVFVKLSLNSYTVSIGTLLND